MKAEAQKSSRMVESMCLASKSASLEQVRDEAERQERLSKITGRTPTQSAIGTALNPAADDVFLKDETVPA